MDPNRPYMTPREARRFTKEYIKLNKMLTARFVGAESMAEAKGAEEAAVAEHDASFSMYQYGLMLLDGMQGIRQDAVTGKYWMEKAAAVGFRPAKKEQRKRWK